jgi:glycosyltransferase involved in cell wall biosynthesis
MTTMTEQSPNKKDLTKLVDNYANHIIDGLDYKDMEQMLFDMLQREYEKLSWDDVTEEIVDLYDEDTLINLLP